MKIAPSILSADFSKLGEEIKAIEPYADFIHVDVMDGHFVPNITIGPCVVSSIKSSLPLDVHLMIENPEKYIEDFAKAGAYYICVHYEATNNIKALVEQIKSAGCKAAVSVKPKTPASEIIDLLPELDMVLVMTVEPGFGGQSFMEDQLGKIQELKKVINDNGLSTLIEVDGGINSDTAHLVVEAGADILVAGSAIFGKNDYKEAIDLIKRK